MHTCVKIPIGHPRSNEHLLISNMFRHGDRLAHPAKTVRRGEDKSNRAHFGNRGEVLKHVTNIRRWLRTHGGADGHHGTSGGEIRKRKGKHEKRRTIFTKLRVFDDYSNDENIQRYIE